MTTIGTMIVISTITTTLLLTVLGIVFLEYCGPTEPEPWDFDLELFTEFVGAMRHAGNGISCEFIQNNR